MEEYAVEGTFLTFVYADDHKEAKNKVAKKLRGVDVISNPIFMKGRKERTKRKWPLTP